MRMFPAASPSANCLPSGETANAQTPDQLRTEILRLNGLAKRTLWYQPEHAKLHDRMDVLIAYLFVLEA